MYLYLNRRHVHVCSVTFENEDVWHACKYTYIVHIHIHTCTHTYACKCTCKYKYMCINTCTYTSIYIHVHIYTHIHIRESVFRVYCVGLIEQQFFFKAIFARITTNLMRIYMYMSIHRILSCITRLFTLHNLRYTCILYIFLHDTFIYSVQFSTYLYIVYITVNIYVYVFQKQGFLTPKIAHFCM